MFATCKSFRTEVQINQEIRNDLFTGFGCEVNPRQNISFFPSLSVLKMKIKEAKKEKSDRKLIAAQKKKKVLKQGMLRKKDLKKLTLYIKNGANCPCSQLENLGSNFLIMGRKVDQQLLLMSIYKWDKKSKELKFAIKSMKTKQCSYIDD